MKMLAIHCATAVALTIGGFEARASIIAGPITHPANGNEYYLLSQNTWTAAELEAENLGGTLAIVKNSTEQDWIYSTFNSYGDITNRFLWISLRRQWQGGPFEWVTGEALVYTNWSVGEPDNCQGNEGFVQFWNSSTKYAGKWNDAADAFNFYGAQPSGVVEVNCNRTITEKEKSLVGVWYEGGRLDRPCYFAATTNFLFAIRNYGVAAKIIYDSGKFVFATNWHIRGEPIKDKILWSDGSWWSRTPSNYKVEDVQPNFITGFR